ncbi:MAG: FMN-binding glutamate synthase family protein [Nitrospinota bacterium]|nr:FMN-binding glutamate synthase family protein [Nitrospinota bacterium]
MFPDWLMNLVQLFTLGVLLAMFLGPPLFLLLLFIKNRRQTQHSLLRGRYWFIGLFRYLIESIGPEMRFYISDEDNEGKPISRVKFTTIVKAAKYLKTLISYGSKRDFSAPGLYIKNSMFPSLNSEMEVDNSIILPTQKYIIRKEGLFWRDEEISPEQVKPWFLEEKNMVVVGPERQRPWPLKGLLGMSAMSYGALGQHAITALSEGIGMARGAWMNTGEGGLSQYHLAGGCDLIFQIGPGLFGVRDREGNLDWDQLRLKAQIPQVKAIEIKLGQGAKIRGGHVEGVKVTPEIARIRGVEPWKNIDSPNRFPLFNDTHGLVEFIAMVQDATGLPVGIKMVVGDNDALDELCSVMIKDGRGPDFIALDGGEGGSGATYKEMADSLGLPIYCAIVIADNALRKAGLRQKVKLIAAGRLHLPDEQAVALALGADLVAAARSFMIATGCIMTEKCHSNECPVGVATTNPELQRLLFVGEKKYRVMNYIITCRAALFSLSAAMGLKSPTGFSRRHVVFKDDRMRAINAQTLFPYPG